MTREDIADVLKAYPLPSPIKLYTIGKKTVFEIRNDHGKVPGLIAYLYVEFPTSRYALEFPDDATPEQVKATLDKGLAEYQKKLKGPNL